MIYFDYKMKLRFSLSWKSLTYKYEYNISTSEDKFYIVFPSMVYEICSALGLDYQLGESLAMSKGLLFPPSGEAGFYAVEDYVKYRNIDIDIESLKVKVLKRQLALVKYPVSEEFTHLLTDMILDKSEVKEAKLTNICYKLLKKIQPLMDINLAKFYSLVDEIKNYLIQQFRTSHEIIDVDITHLIPKEIGKRVTQLSKKDKEDYFLEMDTQFEMAKEDFKLLEDKDLIVTAVSYLLIN